MQLCLRVSRGIVEVVPAFRCNNIGHSSGNENNTWVRPPCTTEPHVTSTTDCAVDEGEATVLVLGATPVCSHGSVDRLWSWAQLVRHWYYSTVLSLSQYHIKMDGHWIETLIKRALNQNTQKVTEIFTYLVERFSVAKYEINGALNVAILEVMTTSIVMKSVLSSEETTSNKRWFISRDSYCHRLSSYVSWLWYRSHVLSQNISQHQSYFNVACFVET